MTTTDPVSAAARSALLASLCAQSATLAGILHQVSTVRDGVQPTIDGWHGPAERAQSLLVERFSGMADDAIAILKRAVEDTNKAIWAVSSDG